MELIVNDTAYTMELVHQDGPSRFYEGSLDGLPVKVQLNGDQDDEQVLRDALEGLLAPPEGF